MKSRPTSAVYLGYGAFSAECAAVFSWDTFLYHGNQVLAVTTTVSMPKENRPFITLEF